MIGHVQDQKASDCLYSVGHWLLEQARNRDAVELFRAFIMVAPRDERAWLGLTECHCRLGQPLTALEMVGSGLMLASSAVRLYLMRVRLLRSLDRTYDAHVALEAAREAAEGDDELEALVRMEALRS